MKRISLAVFGLLAAAAYAGAPAGRARRKPVQTEQSMERKVVRIVRANYLLYLPKGYGKEKKAWPLMLFLHGAGERGTALALVKKHGPPKLVEKGREFPFILVSPQCPHGAWWDMDVLTGLLDEIAEKYTVDADRVYVTGLSMGGYGTWSLASRHPGRFAGIVPICGGGNAHTARRMKDIPTWVFHGGKDPVVPTSQSQRMVDAMKRAGAKDVKLTIYPDAGHDSWTKAYEDPELYKWLLRQKRKKKPQPKAKAPVGKDRN